MSFSSKKIIITNFPTSDTPIYVQKKLRESYKITKKGLTAYYSPTFIFNTTFVLKTFFTDEDMAKIEFHKSTQKLIVTSSGVPYNRTNNELAFKFELIDPINSIVKSTVTILGSENANRFKDTLNNEPFSYGDLIRLRFLDKSKVILINYPNTGDVFTFPNNLSIIFVITNEGITPILSPTKIKVKSLNNEEVLSIKFASQLQQFIVSSKEAIADSSTSSPYLTLILKDQNGHDILKSTLNSNEKGYSFKASLNTKDFSLYNNTLTLIYKDSTKIEISNYPDIGDMYTPTSNINTFIIHPKTLEDITFRNQIRIINDKNEEMTTLYFIPSFISSLVTTFITQTNAICTNDLKENETYLEYLQYYLFCNAFKAQILSKEDATNFSNTLNNININVALPTVLRLCSKFANKVIITNYKNEDEYKVGTDPEFINITNGALIPHNLKYNKIQLKNKDNTLVLTLYFDEAFLNIMYIEPFSTGVINKDSDFFSFRILDENKRFIKIEGRINKGEYTPTVNIDSNFNISKNFKFGNILELNYSHGDLIEIFNFPFTSPPYTLKGNLQKFTIANNSLIPLNLLPNAFIFNSLHGDEKVAIVEFNIDTLKILVSSTGISYNQTNKLSAFKFRLIRNDELILKAVIKSNEDGNKFKNTLNGKSFQYEDLIFLTFVHSNKAKLTNYPKKGASYGLNPLNSQGFIITRDGIIPYVFSNEILLNNSYNELVLSIKFDIITKRFLLGNTGNKTNKSTNLKYFTLTLYTIDGITILKTATIKGNDNCYDFINSFKNTAFQVGYIIKLEYEENDKIVITNFPSITTPIYIPPKKNISFEIHKDKLLPYVPTTLEEQEIEFINAAKIRFNLLTKELIVTSTNKAPLPSLKNTSCYLFKLRDSFNNIKLHSLIKTDESADNFVLTLNKIGFQFEDIIELDAFMANSITVKNFPTKEENKFINVAPFNLDTFKGFFIITPSGLQFYNPSVAPPLSTLQNNIIINKVNDTPLIVIKFNTLDKVIQTFSFSSINDSSSTYTYVNFKLYDLNNILITSSTLPSKGNFSDFTSKLKFKNFNYNYTIELTYNIKAMSHIIITNLQGLNHVPTLTKERYRITTVGLIPLTI